MTEPKRRREDEAVAGRKILLVVVVLAWLAVIAYLLALAGWRV